MLVLSRHARETIVLRNGEDEVLVHVAAIDRGRVVIGVEASREWTINRREIQDKEDEARQ